MHAKAELAPDFSSSCSSSSLSPPSNFSSSSFSSASVSASVAAAGVASSFLPLTLAQGQSPLDILAFHDRDLIFSSQSLLSTATTTATNNNNPRQRLLILSASRFGLWCCKTHACSAGDRRSSSSTPSQRRPFRIRQQTPNHRGRHKHAHHLSRMKR